MEAFQGRLLRYPTVRKPVLIAASSALGFALFGLAISNLLGFGRTVQLVTTLVVPAGILLTFAKAAKERISQITEAARVTQEIERAAHRATAEYLAAVSHSLTIHRELCNLRAEALEVAMEYREASEHIKVAVPDLVLSADVLAMRQVLHALISNAVRHGGERIALWGTVEDSELTVTVSDDGPGVASEFGDRLFERFVDLGASAVISGSGTGLTVARDLVALLGGEMSYRRDSSWSHFSFTFPIEVEIKTSVPEHELEARVS